MEKEKVELIIALYKKILENLDKAEKAIRENKHVDKIKYMEKVENIILELNQSLDMKNGGEIAQKLASLYDFALYNLTKANLKNDLEALKGVRKVINILLEGWEKLKNKL